MTTYYIIRQKSTGFTFQIRGQQGSWQEPAEGIAYRLWTSLRSARGWLTTWCKGGQIWEEVRVIDWEGIPDDDKKFIGYENPRDRDDYEIVPCVLSIGEPLEEK